MLVDYEENNILAKHQCVNFTSVQFYGCVKYKMIDLIIRLIVIRE